MQTFNAALASVGLDARCRSEYHDEWQKVSAQIDYFPVNYSETKIDYEIEYWRGNGVEIADVSLVLYFDNRPVGIWPVSVVNGDVIRLGSNGGVLQPPLFDRRLALKSVKRVITVCQDLLDSFCRVHSLPAWESKELLPGKHWLSEWHLAAMTRGAETGLRHDLFVDLSLDLTAIKHRFRKSYKSLITSGRKDFQVGLLNREGDESTWQEFRALHLAAAGRMTRSEESWNLQYLALLSGAVFLVYLRDHAGRLVGGALFNTSRDEGYYFVGAYDRDLFDKPIGHLIQYEAIVEMKRLGLRWYHIGARPFPAEQPQLTEKQAAIVHFQDGFATHILPRYIVSRKIVA
ncbi:MAG: FemAB family protein [Betaproteobacteria bacterium]